MYVRNMRNGLLDQYAFVKGLCARKSSTFVSIFEPVVNVNLTFSFVFVQASYGSITLTTTSILLCALISLDPKPYKHFKMWMLHRTLIFHPAR